MKDTKNRDELNKRTRENTVHFMGNWWFKRIYQKALRYRILKGHGLHSDDTIRYECPTIILEHHNTPFIF